MQNSEISEIVRFSFSPDYEIEIDPEFPSSGTWALIVRYFNRDGQLVADFEARWGAPRVIIVHPAHSPSWVGFFPHGGLGGTDGVFAMPSNSGLCVSVGGSAYVVDVDHLEHGATVLSSVQQVVASAEPPLLLFSDFTEIVAFDAEGQAWESSRLALDDLRITSTENGVVRAQGLNYELEQFELDARTGTPIK